MPPDMARHVPRPDHGHFEEMTRRTRRALHRRLCTHGARLPAAMGMRAGPRRRGTMKGGRSGEPDGGGSERDGGDPSSRIPAESAAPSGAQDFVAGLTPGLSLKNCLFSSVKFFQFAGTSSSAKIAFTGQTGSQAPQSMHSSGWM